MVEFMDIISYVSQNFHGNVYFDSMLEFARSNNLQINTAEEFANALVTSMKQLFPDIDVYSSSTFAVTQEFLGNLNDEDAFYTSTRDGIWSVKYINGTCEIISTRMVLVTVYELYPSDD